MIADSNVDLPLPLGPINACISPVLIVKASPFSISLSSIQTCKFSIFKVDINQAPFYPQHFTKMSQKKQRM